MGAVAALLVISVVTDGAASAASAASKRPFLGGIFGGYTSKGWPVVIEVSRSGKRVTKALAGIESACTNGGALTVPDGWRNLPIRGRRFHGSYADMETQNGMRFEGSGSISGRMNGKRTRISGTWTAKVVVRDAAGTIIDTCQSGSVSFSARRK